MSKKFDDPVRFNTTMNRRLRDDAKRETEHGELADEIRDLFRRIAYGTDGEEQGELDRVRAELEAVRDRKDDLRRERRRVDAEIESVESRETRLEERIETLESKDDKFDTVVETLESFLLDGQRIIPSRVDDDLDPHRVIEELQARNPDVPAVAFETPAQGDPVDWREM